MAYFYVEAGSPATLIRVGKVGRIGGVCTWSVVLLGCGVSFMVVINLRTSGALNFR